jgi:type IV secretory pathway TrbD component
MTAGFGPHLTPDEFDLWLTAELDSDRARHLELCLECQARADAERALDEQLATLQLLSPAPDLADRVMRHVAVPRPLAVPSMLPGRPRVLATRRSMAVAASIAVLLLASMAGSAIWTLGHQATLTSIGAWLLTQTGQAGWLAIQGVASNLIEQPWYGVVRSAFDSPGRIAAASALATAAYLAGVFALRRLLALPTQQVAHAGA